MANLGKVRITLRRAARTSAGRARSVAVRCCVILVAAGWLLAFEARDTRAGDPPTSPPEAKLVEPTYDDFERGHWSFRPRKAAAWPQLSAAGDAWARTEIDRWIWQRLEAAQLQPAPDATPAVMLRRLTYDLTGLPPSLDDLDAFATSVRDDGPDAIERLVDRLLASPRYGERQAQHWFDVVRYAESEGFEYDNHRPGAWRYRDYVIQSFNADKPFDQFAREQLAGDETPEPTPDAQIAVGFHRLGPVRRNAGNGDVAFSRNEVLTEMTDSVGAVFLGLTVGCARCHDHKFDAIRQVDYYRLQAFLAATDEHDIPLASADETRRWTEATQRIKNAQKQIREEMQSAQGAARDQLAAKYKQLEAELPAPLPTISSMRNQAERTAAVRMLQRGQTDRPLFEVGPRVLGVLRATGAVGASDQPAFKPGAPKTALANWLLNPEHPLTSRVLANRLWQWRFGAGLVATPNDFGVNGANPSHPELLDLLATRLVDNWQLKPLHRALVTSRVYRQASRVESAAQREAAQRVDPENRGLWHFSRQRVDAESLRDTLLSISGRMDLSMGGPSVIVPVEQELVNLLYKPDQWAVTPGDAARHRRSVYMIAKRNLRVPLLETFDQPDLQTSCGRRTSSTHAPQALEMLNGAVANELADALAWRLEREGGSSADARIELAFRLAAGRAPLDVERALSREFLSRSSTREFALAILNLHALMYVE